MSDDKTTRHFIEELQRLKERLLEMGELATSRIDRAVSGLTSRDPVILDDVIQGDESINTLQIELDDRCFKLLALRQPMATDLRLIMSTTRITSDLERVGDLAVNVAEAAARYIQYPPVKPLIDLPKMSELAQQMLRDALSSFVSGEVTLASDVLKRDDSPGRPEAPGLPGSSHLHAQQSGSRRTGARSRADLTASRARGRSRDQYRRGHHLPRRRPRRPASDQPIRRQLGLRLLECAIPCSPTPFGS